MKVALFGLGYVGAVTATCLATRGHLVIGVDTDAGKVDALNGGRPPVVEPGLTELVVEAIDAGALRATGSVAAGLADANVSIVCVGTPSSPDGSTDLSQVGRVVTSIGAELARRDRPHTVVIRSTVPPGTVEGILAPLLEQSSGRSVSGGDLRITMCPEFLREGTSVADFFDPPFLVIGGTEETSAPLRELFDFLTCSVHVVPIRAAESIKYACNAFHAVKVSFTNELARLCRSLDVDARQVMEVFVEDRQLNISPAYLRPGFAFGGSCLPKDLRSLLHLGRMRSLDLPLLGGTLSSNEIAVRDVAERILSHVEQDGGTNRRVALLGLSFKHQTDDLRESPNVALAEMLIGKGLDVRIHDPVVKPARLQGGNLRYVQSRLPHLHKVLFDTASEALRDARVAVISSTAREVARAVIDARPPMTIDLSGCLGPEFEALAGYQGVCW